MYIRIHNALGFNSETKENILLQKVTYLKNNNFSNQYIDAVLLSNNYSTKQINQALTEYKGN